MSFDSDPTTHGPQRLLEPSQLETATAIVESAHHREDRYAALDCDGPGRVVDSAAWLACGLLARARRSDVIAETREVDVDPDGRETFPLRPGEARWR